MSQESIRAALILNDKCLDLKGILLIKGVGLILLEDPISIAAGAPSEELLAELEQLNAQTKLKPSHAP